jgi:hypothetical protein
LHPADVNFPLLILVCSFEKVVAMFAYTIQKVCN